MPRRASELAARWEELYEQSQRDPLLYEAQEAAWDEMVEAIQDHADDCPCKACKIYNRVYPQP